jgi:hypothetical protein
MSHRCPSPGCAVDVPDDQLACHTHWYSLPKPMQRAVWAAWDGGHGAGSIAHTKAIEAAIDYLARKAAK